MKRAVTTVLKPPAHPASSAAAQQAYSHQRCNCNGVRPVLGISDYADFSRIFQRTSPRYSTLKPASIAISNHQLEPV